MHSGGMAGGSGVKPPTDHLMYARGHTIKIKMLCMFQVTKACKSVFKRKAMSVLHAVCYVW